MASNTILQRATDFIETRVIPWWSELACRLPNGQGQFAVPFLLAAIFLQLREMTEGQKFGSNSFRIDPFTLGAEPVRILEADPASRMRKVQIWVDAATGGPLPTIRVSTGASGTGGGGIRILPGQMNDLDVVPANITL